MSINVAMKTNKNDIHVICFFNREQIIHRKESHLLNPDNIVKGDFYIMCGGSKRQFSIGHFIKIFYEPNNGYFMLECMHNDANTMPSQFLSQNPSFCVIFNGKTYRYNDLNQLYVDFINYETNKVIDSLP